MFRIRQARLANKAGDMPGVATMSASIWQQPFCRTVFAKPSCNCEVHITVMMSSQPDIALGAVLKLDVKLSGTDQSRALRRSRLLWLAVMRILNRKPVCPADLSQYENILLSHFAAILCGVNDARVTEAC